MDFSDPQKCGEPQKCEASLWPFRHYEYQMPLTTDLSTRATPRATPRTNTSKDGYIKTEPLPDQIEGFITKDKSYTTLLDWTPRCIHKNLPDLLKNTVAFGVTPFNLVDSCNQTDEEEMNVSDFDEKMDTDTFIDETDRWLHHHSSEMSPKAPQTSLLGRRPYNSGMKEILRGPCRAGGPGAKPSTAPCRAGGPGAKPSTAPCSFTAPYGSAKLGEARRSSAKLGEALSLPHNDTIKEIKVEETEDEPMTKRVRF